MRVGNLTDIKNAIEKYDNIVIFHHIRPDGDCLGSQFALKELIQDNFPHKMVYAIGDHQDAFKFMNFEHDLIPNDEILAKSLGIVVDANFKERIEFSDVLDKNLFAQVIRIDHHPNEDDLAENAIRWVDSTYVAADEMVTELAVESNWKITPKAANYLYLGIYTDSGRFLYNNTCARTFNLVAHLYQAGLDADFIHKNLSQTTLEDLKFNAWLMSTLKTREGVAYIQNDLLTTKKYGKTSQGSLRVNSIANIKGFPIWVQFLEEEDGRVRVEFRSNGPIVRNVALKWGGGGHERAAGCIIDSFDQVELVIDDCAYEVERYTSEQE
ncbi:DHH family phosphoesterase [Mycoplasma sp. 5912]